ncbi:MAG: NCS2 family permease, partial [Pseudomonadota bacterium]
MQQLLEQQFAIRQHGSSVQRELTAGFTTFLAMAYITVVNPAILSDAGMDFGAVFVATCLAAALGTAIMGLYANYPVAQAPGMGQNAFFTYGVVLGLGHTWQSALGAVFISGLIFIVLSILPVREWLINAIPRSLKLGISAGIGFFLGIIALTGSGIVVSNEATIVGLGDLTELPAILML